MDSIYDRQRDIHLWRPERVAVVGCGGIGFWVGTLLAMSGVEKLILIDSDRIQPHNLNRLPLPANTVGRPKVEVLKSYIVNLRPEAYVMAIDSPVIVESLKALGVNLVMDCTDVFSVQQSLYKYCRANGIIYIRCGYDGLTEVNVTSILPEWEVDDVDTHENERYRVTPSWVAPAVFVAALGVFKALYAISFEFNRSITSLHMS